MTPEQYKFVKEILAKACELEGNERLAFVKNACQSQPEVIESILNMLDIGDSTAAHQMDKPAIVEHLPELDSQPKLKEEPVLIKGTLVGQYQIIGKIGSGGMGNVYSAQQRFPAERQVALKLLKNTPNQDYLISEIQILAQLNHPNIATLYEVDKTDQERLFIAMELIDGGDIVSWCKSNQYEIKPTIELFQQLCMGISYAHIKGIVHCDIKPNNVLITEINDNPTVKIIDFGISRFNKKRYSKDEISGTPAYLAPEVLANKDSEITDTRRDVYALGILLKKLLPLEIPEDLKAIINKATNRDKEKRYASPTSVNFDLNRFLKQRPVRARNNSYVHITKLFVQRNLAAVLFSTVLLLSLIGGFIAQYRQAQIAIQQAQVAKHAQLEAEDLSEFLTEMFNVANPERSNSSVITSDDLLYKAMGKLLGIENPTLKDARFMHTVGTIYISMEKLQNALLLIEKSLEIKKAQLPENHLEIIIGSSQLGLIYKKLGEHSKAENYLIKAINASKSHSDLGYVQLANNYNILGNLYIATHQVDKAIEQHKLAIEIRKKVNDLKALANSYNNLGVIYNNTKKWHLAAKYYYLALDIYTQEYDENHPFIGVIKNNLAYIEEQKFNWQKSEELLIDAWLNWQYAYGENHSNTITAQRNLAYFYDRRMQYQKAIDLYDLLIKSFVKSSNTELQAKYTSKKAQSYAGLSHFDEAIQYHQEALDIAANITIKEKYLYAKLHSQFAKSLIQKKDYQKAKDLLNVAILHLKNNVPLNDYHRLYTLNVLADLYYQIEDYKQSEELFKDVTTHNIPLVVRNQLRQVNAHLGLGRVFYQVNDIEQSQKEYTKALQINQSIYGEQHKVNGIIFYELAKLKLSQDKLTQAKELLNQALEIQTLILPKNHKNLLATIASLKSLD